MQHDRIGQWASTASKPHIRCRVCVPYFIDTFLDTDTDLVTVVSSFLPYNNLTWPLRHLPRQKSLLGPSSVQRLSYSAIKVSARPVSLLGATILSRFHNYSISSFKMSLVSCTTRSTIHIKRPLVSTSSAKRFTSTTGP